MKLIKIKHRKAAVHRTFHLQADGGMKNCEGAAHNTMLVHRDDVPLSRRASHEVLGQPCGSHVGSAAGSPEARSAPAWGIGCRGNPSIYHGG